MAVSVKFPRSDAGLLAWSVNFDQLIVANPTDYGLTAALASGYHALHLAWASAYQTAVNPTTKTEVTVELKDQARTALKQEAVRLAQLIQGAAGTTDAERLALRITVPKARTPINPIADAPVTTITEMNGWGAKGRVKALGSERRGLAEGAAGIHVYSFAGPAAPTNVNDYKFEGACSRSTFEVNFDPDLAVGSKVWICVCWVTARFLTSPACTPIGLVIGGGVPEVTAG